MSCIVSLMEKKILTNLNGDSIVDTVKIRQLVIKIDRLMEDLDEKGWKA